MSNLSDKEIDRLSREAADSYEPDDSSLSWSRLEQKLDHTMPERPPDRFRFGRMNPYVWGPAAILLAGASFFAIKNIHYRQHFTPNIQTVNPSVSVPDKSKNESGNTIHLDSIAAVQESAGGENIHSSATDRKPVTSANTDFDTDAGKLSGSISNKSFANRDAVYGHKQSNRKNSASKVLNSGAIVAAGSSETSGKVLGGEQNADKTNGIVAGIGANGMAGSAQNKNQIHLPVIISHGNGLGKVTGNDSLMNKLAESKTPIRQKSLHLNRSLNIGFTFGPDYTNAGGIANNQIGNNIGLTLGYYLSDRLSINTGFIYSNRFYWSKAHNYFFQQTTNNTGSFAAPPPIDYINGASNIWELPLTLRYDFAHQNKTKFFANAGLSSYFMMKQTYIYFLHSNQNQLAYKISDNQQVNYWFGIADISVGFETEIGKGFSFQAEPFLKLPLQNMGKEDLRLTSYGFLMTFKYAPVLSRSKK